jgi:hypothetical protein
MDAHLASVLWFALGVVVQALLVIRIDRTWSTLDWGLLALCVVLSASGMLPSKHEVYVPLNNVLSCIGIFGFTLALVFERRILPVINEQIALSYTLVFWYAIFVNFQSLGLPDWLLYASSVPTSATLIIAFTQPALNLFWKASMYAWFMVLLLSLGLIQFSFGRLLIFTSPNDAPWLTPIECVSTGMAFLYLCINATFVFELIPIPGKTQSWKDRMREWHDLTNLMAHRFDDGASPAVVAGMIVAVEGGVLVLNFIYHFIPDGLLINLFVVLPGLLYFGNRVAPPAPTPDKGGA